MKKEKIAILGPGAVGGFLAVLLANNGFDVICLTKKESCRIINKKGLSLKSKIFQNIKSYPKAQTTFSDKRDIIFICTKSYDLREALKKIPKSKTRDALIMPLLNGFEHVKLIRTQFGENVTASTISIEVVKKSPTEIIHISGHPKIEIATSPKIDKQKILKVIKVLESVGIRVEIFPNEQDVLWRKLIRLNTIALLTAISQKPIGYILSHRKWKEYLIEVLAETVKIAKTQNVEVNTKKVFQQIKSLNKNFRSSLSRDFKNAKNNELETITGAVLKLAKKNKLETPIMSKLYNHLKGK